MLDSGLYDVPRLSSGSGFYLLDYFYRGIVSDVTNHL